jgi:hypothetical protein
MAPAGDLGITIGSGRCGPVTEAVQSTCFDTIKGALPDTWDWLTCRHPEGAAGRAATAGPAAANVR